MGASEKHAATYHPGCTAVSPEGQTCGLVGHGDGTHWSPDLGTVRAGRDDGWWFHPSDGATDHEGRVWIDCRACDGAPDGYRCFDCGDAGGTWQQPHCPMRLGIATCNRLNGHVGDHEGATPAGYMHWTDTDSERARHV